MGRGKSRGAHFEDVSQRHGSVREAVHKECLQQALDVVERVADAGEASEVVDSAGANPPTHPPTHLFLGPTHCTTVCRLDVKSYLRP